jgi:hypothetical protein
MIHLQDKLITKWTRNMLASVKHSSLPYHNKKWVARWYGKHPLPSITTNLHKIQWYTYYASIEVIFQRPVNTYWS